MSMKLLLQLEELAQFAVGIYLFSDTGNPWWYFPALILLPDLSMIGYLINPAIGAFTYNLVHHKAFGIAVAVIGFMSFTPWMYLAGIILFSHSAMDRIFGYGLKYKDDFKHTHMGWIGKKS
jgi:hypothetical protein